MTTLEPVSVWTHPKTFLVAFFSFGIPYLFLSLWFLRHIWSKPRQKRSSVVLVLGDFGRSPRMMYHAQSLVDHGYQTYVVGYGDTAPIASLSTPNPPSPISSSSDDKGKCHFYYLSPLKWILSLPLPWALRAAIRLIHQTGSVFWIIWFSIPVHTEYILVQTPPAIPTLAVVQIAAMMSGSRVVIDWHNTGYSVLAQRLGKLKPIMWLAKSLERITGREAYAHLFVSRAMRQELATEFELEGRKEVLHDRPPRHFSHTSPSAKAALLRRLLPDPPLDLAKSKILISSTSWSTDEDFSPLITALDDYAACAYIAHLPPLLVLITGKGPLRAQFEATIAKRCYADIMVKCLFVTAADYPTLLGCADLGLSFHASTSGTDLPMKIVDMLGCGVPVLALGYRTLDELLVDGKNGRVFHDAEELSDLLQDYMLHPEKIEALRANIKEEKRWEENWDEVVYRRILAS